MKKWKIASEDNLYYEVTDSEGQLVGYVAKFDENYKDEERLKLNLVLNAPEMLEMLSTCFNMCDKMVYPTEQELKEVSLQLKRLISKITI